MGMSMDGKEVIGQAKNPNKITLTEGVWKHLYGVLQSDLSGKLHNW
jgi:hypothetical protein